MYFANVYTYILSFIEYIDLTTKMYANREQRYWIKDFSLYASDRLSLLSGDWLSDAIINCAQNLLKEQYPLVGGLQSTTLGYTLSYTIERGEFVQIINVRDSHWVTISNIGCKPDYINVYDSLPYKDISYRAKQQISALIHSAAKEITLNFPPVQCQRGGSDCGLFAIAFAVTLCTGFNPSDLQYNQASFRSHLRGCIENKCISPFPCTMLAKKRQDKEIHQVVPFYCICRQPEGGKMAECTTCGDWFHEECVELPDNIELDDVEWFCPTCSYRCSKL